ncbi:MAG TPA: Maf family protein [Fibrobacteraceae bacterium]|nr:Maf family protein [Fibrobacteraceae bacterium]
MQNFLCPLVLASASPRRQSILHQLGIEFSIGISDIDESKILGPIREIPRLLAECKAEAVSRKNPGALVLGYDTLVYLNDIPLGKPTDADDARRMLWSLRGKWHDVQTGFALFKQGIRLHSGIEQTKVLFRTFPKSEMDDYIAGNEPFDKAGAYGIQGQGARFVKSINGCFYNVVGLPVAQTLEALSVYWRKDHDG